MSRIAAEILGRDGIEVSAQTLGNWTQLLQAALVKEIMGQTHLYNVERGSSTSKSGGDSKVQL